jgi:hypothetical protein
MARALSNNNNNNKLTAMGFKRTRNGEPRGRETSENEEVVEVETGMNEATQDQRSRSRGGQRDRMVQRRAQHGTENWEAIWRHESPHRTEEHTHPARQVLPTPYTTSTEGSERGRGGIHGRQGIRRS